MPSAPEFIFGTALVMLGLRGPLAIREGIADDDDDVILIEGVAVYNYGEGRQRFTPGLTKPDEMHGKIPWLIYGQEDSDLLENAWIFEDSSIIMEDKELPLLDVVCTEEQLAQYIKATPKVKFVERNSDVDLETFDAAYEETKGAKRARMQATEKHFGEKEIVEAMTPWWALNRIGLSHGAPTGRGVNVIVMDSGIRTDHAEFGGRAIPMLDVSNGFLLVCDGAPTCAQDEAGFGTAAAGAVGGTHVGVAPEVTLYSVKLFPKKELARVSWIAKALEWVIANRPDGPTVVLFNWDVKGRFVSVRKALRELAHRGVTVIAGAGDRATDACQYVTGPLKEVITVGSTDMFRDNRAMSSNYGKCVDLWAPGIMVNAPGLLTRKHMGSGSGTGVAAGLVAGVVATWYQTRPTDTPAIMKGRLEAEAEQHTVTRLEGEKASTERFLRFVDLRSMIWNPDASMSRKLVEDKCGLVGTYDKLNRNCYCPVRSKCSVDITSIVVCPTVGTIMDVQAYDPSCTECRCFRFE